MTTKCESCGKQFKNSDEVTLTDAMGIDVLVHTNCLYAYVLGASMQTYYTYYESYKEYKKENK